MEEEGVRWRVVRCMMTGHLLTVRYERNGDGYWSLGEAVSAGLQKKGLFDPLTQAMRLILAGRNIATTPIDDVLHAQIVEAATIFYSVM